MRLWSGVPWWYRRALEPCTREGVVHSFYALVGRILLMPSQPSTAMSAMYSVWPCGVPHDPGSRISTMQMGSIMSNPRLL